MRIDIFKLLGGGGHKAASGCTVPLPLAAAKLKLLMLLERAVNR